MKILGLFDSRNGQTEGEQYAEINTTLKTLAKRVEVDLWILDDLMGRLESWVNERKPPTFSVKELVRVRFNQIEAHLSEFLKPSQSHKKMVKPQPFTGKVDWAKNKETGNWGEDFVVEYERETLRRAGKADLAAAVEAVCRTDDGLGYDVRSFSLSGQEIHIEVKTTTGKASDSIWLTENERTFLEENKESSYLYRVFNARDKTARLVKIKPPLDKVFDLTPAVYRGKLREPTAP